MVHACSVGISLRLSCLPSKAICCSHANPRTLVSFSLGARYARFVIIPQRLSSISYVHVCFHALVVRLPICVLTVGVTFCTVTSNTLTVKGSQQNRKTNTYATNVISSNVKSRQRFHNASGDVVTTGTAFEKTCRRNTYCKYRNHTTTYKSTLPAATLLFTLYCACGRSSV